jgi:hypothetical protein
VKNRVARLRALGNAVVPAQAYQIFRAIMEAEGAKVMGSEQPRVSQNGES